MSNQSIDRVILLMNYDTSRTYTENLSEQILMGGPALHFSMNKLVNKITPDWSDPHSVAQWFEITLFLLSFVSGPAAPLLLAGSTIAGLVDAGIYWKEGDYHSAIIFALLSIIPGGELLSVLKKNPYFKQLGKEGTKTLLKLLKTGKIGAEDYKKLKSIIKSIFESKDEISRLAKIETKKKLLKWIGKQNSKTLLNILWTLKKTGIIPIAKVGLMISGSWVTGDQLYMWLYRNDPEMQKNRENSAATKLLNDLKLLIKSLNMSDEEFEKYINEELQKETEKIVDESIKKGIDFTTIQTDPKKIMQEIIDKHKTETPKNIEQKTNNSSSYTDAPRTIDVENGIAEIKKGHRGKSVGEIQKMLSELGYSETLTSFGEFQKPIDNYFANATELAVKSFQEDNGLKIDGVVGKNTLKKLREKHKNIK